MKAQDMTRDRIGTAQTLSQALPYLQRYSGAIVVVKFGGNAMGDQAAMSEFARDIVLIVVVTRVLIIDSGEITPRIRHD